MDERSWKIIGVGSISLSDVVWFSRMSDQEIGCSRMYFVAVEDVCKQKVNFLANFLVNFLVNVFLSGITFQYICGEMRSVNLISRGNKEWQGSWRSWRGDDQKPKQSFRFFDAWCARKPHRLAYAVRAKNIVNKVHLGWRVWSGEYSLQGSRDALATGEKNSDSQEVARLKKVIQMLSTELEQASLRALKRSVWYQNHHIMIHMICPW